MRKCIVTHPECKPFETEAESEEHAIQRFKSEWCSMGETTQPFSVQWLGPPEPGHPSTAAATEPPRSPAVADPKPPAMPVAETRIEMVHGLTGPDVIAFQTAELRTVEAVVEHARKTGTLADINGISTADERRIRTAIKTWQRTQKT